MCLACVAVFAGCTDPHSTPSASRPIEWDEPIPIEVTGREFAWRIRYSGPDGVLGTADDRHTVRNLHAPRHTQLRVILKSEDYLYSFSVPNHQLKEIAVPDLSFELLIQTGDSGTLAYRGDQFCGFSHPDLSGEIVVQSDDEFAAWLAALPAHP